VAATTVVTAADAVVVIMAIIVVVAALLLWRWWLLLSRMVDVNVVAIVAATGGWLVWVHAQPGGSDGGCCHFSDQ
jgi:hypothetical protein